MNKKLAIIILGLMLISFILMATVLTPDKVNYPKVHSLENMIVLNEYEIDGLEKLTTIKNIHCKPQYYDGKTIKVATHKEFYKMFKEEDSYNINLYKDKGILEILRPQNKSKGKVIKAITPWIPIVQLSDYAKYFFTPNLTELIIFIPQDLYLKNFPESQYGISINNK